MYIYLLQSSLVTTMNLTKTVYEQLTAEKSSGLTHQEMASKHKVATSYITNLLNKKRPIGGISLATLQKMFPNAIINLEGNVSVGAHSAANIASPAAVAINGSCGDHSEALRAKIILSILDLELTPEVQSQILKVVKNA